MYTLVWTQHLNKTDCRKERKRDTETETVRKRPRERERATDRQTGRRKEGSPKAALLSHTGSQPIFQPANPKSFHPSIHLTTKTKPNQTMHSKLWHSFVKFLNVGGVATAYFHT